MRFLLTLLSAIFISICSSSAFAASVWQVSGERTFYLFGTFHVLPKDAYPLPEAYSKALDQCDQLWVEVDKNEFANPAVLGSMQQMMLLPNGVNMADQLSIQAYSQLKEMADLVGVPMSALSQLKPWAAVNQLALMLFQQQGFDSETGLDIYLQAQAEKRGIAVKAFESALWQISLFDALGSNSPDTFIEYSTKDNHKSRELIMQMYQQWQRGDTEQMYRDAEFNNFPEIEDAILTQRNNAWMKTLLAPSSIEQNVIQCVAVGALHMGGPNGLLVQFKNAGYAVKAY